jgi:hypothetical protein
MCGTAAGGFVCFIVRLIARPFTSWSDTTPAPNLGTESRSDAHPPRPGDSTVTKQQKRTVAKLSETSIVQVGDGRGFVVKGEYEWDRLIITAAHCLPSFPRPHPAGYLADRTYQRILGPLGEKPTVWAELLFADPIADIAVLVSPDNQELELSEQADAYDLLLDGAHPLPIVDPPALRPERVRVGEEWIERYAPGRGAVRLLSLDGKWIKARVLRYKRCLTVEPEELVVSGMSGSPILSLDGGAIGAVSNGSMNPILTESLPAGLLRAIKR